MTVRGNAAFRSCVMGLKMVCHDIQGPSILCLEEASNSSICNRVDLSCLSESPKRRVSTAIKGADSPISRFYSSMNEQNQGRALPPVRYLISLSWLSERRGSGEIDLWNKSSR